MRIRRLFAGAAVGAVCVLVSAHSSVAAYVEVCIAVETETAGRPGQTFRQGQEPSEVPGQGQEQGQGQGQEREPVQAPVWEPVQAPVWEPVQAPVWEPEPEWASGRSARHVGNSPT